MPWGVTRSMPSAIERDVVPRDRRVIVVGRQDALAAEPVARGDGSAQPRVRDGAAHVTSRPPLADREQRGITGDRDPNRLGDREDRGPQSLLGDRQRRVEALLGAGDPAVELRDHPRGRSLKDVDVMCRPCHAWNQLDGARPGADDADAPTREIRRVVPLGGVEQLALERLEPVDIRVCRAAQAAEATDEERRRERRLVIDLHLPALPLVVPPGAGDLTAEPDQLPDAELVSAALQVVANLVAARVQV